MHFNTGYYWSPGGYSPGNQDSVSLQHVCVRGGEALLAVVCDGIGSLPGSENASGLVVYRLTEWFYHEGKDLIRGDTKGPLIMLALQKCIHGISQELIKFKESAGHATGTTCSALLMLGRSYYLIHIGDSRIYSISKNNPIKRLIKKENICLRQLTRDDVDASGRLKKALGISIKDRADFDMGRIRRGEVFLLCTDGYYRNNEDGIRTALGNPCADSLDRKLEMLGERAIKKGSRDNLSAIAVYCS